LCAGIGPFHQAARDLDIVVDDLGDILQRGLLPARHQLRDLFDIYPRGGRFVMGTRIHLLKKIRCDPMK
jgi:hypothetical protein